jgi:queuine tRNA-ribosyltransferase
MFDFTLHATDGNARRGTFNTPHGDVETPAFMPVGTLGTVKGVEIAQLRATGAQMILGNTYHLALRPGADVVQQLGGLHAFSGWDGPILTDSGGFQIFSLANLTEITERSAVFRAHTDGRLLDVSPEASVAIQEKLGSDVAMVLDHVVALPTDDETVRDACQRSVRWARRCQDAHRREDQTLFAIVHGGLNPDLRQKCAEQLVAMNFRGYAIGGLSVGEPPSAMYQVLDVTCPALPDNRPRYLMGVGRPEDLIEGICRGIDMFDCVMPTRNGRNGLAFTDEGPLRMRNEAHRTDDRPIEPHCPCPACRRSRGYIRHLFISKEMLGPILLSIHNLTYYQRVITDARQAITERRFGDFFRRRMSQWATSERSAEIER